MTSASESVNRPATIEGAWRCVAPGIYVLVADPDAVNLGLVMGSDAAVLIDCGSTPEQGRRVRESVTTVTHAPLLGAVVSHEHRDHWFGLAAFDDLTSWGHETLTERISDSRVLEEAEGLGLTLADLRLPSRQFSHVAVIDLGDRRVELLHLGHGHSPADVVAYVPDADVMFTGDLIENPHPWFDPESSPQGWPNALNALIGLLRPDTVVVPGHGDVVDSRFVVQQLAELAVVPYEAERLVRAGVTFEQAAGEGDWPLPWVNIAEGVRTAYAELAATGVRPRLPLL